MGVLLHPLARVTHGSRVTHGTWVTHGSRVTHWARVTHLTHLHHAASHASTSCSAAPTVHRPSSHRTHVTQVALLNPEAPAHAPHPPTSVHVHLGASVGAPHALLSHGVLHHAPTLS